MLGWVCGLEDKEGSREKESYKRGEEGLGYDEVGTMDEELTSSAVSSYIDSSGAIDIYAKTCRK